MRMRTITKLFTLLVLCLIGLQVKAQDVSIGPTNGSLIIGASARLSDESGFGRGMYSMWRHEQFPLTIT